MNVRLMILQRRLTMRTSLEAVMKSLKVGPLQWSCVWLEVGRVLRAVLPLLAVWLVLVWLALLLLMLTEVSLAALVLLVLLQAEPRMRRRT